MEESCGLLRTFLPIVTIDQDDELFPAEPEQAIGLAAGCLHDFNEVHEHAIAGAMTLIEVAGLLIIIVAGIAADPGDVAGGFLR